MRKLLKHWYVWLGLVLLLGLAGSVALICSGRGRITQANFDKIKRGMSEEDVKAILGRAETVGGGVDVKRYDRLRWSRGPSWIQIEFVNDGVNQRHIHLATTWETFIWHAKSGAAKIGIKWN